MDKLTAQVLEWMIWGEEVKSKFRSIICPQGHSYCRVCTQDYSHFKFNRYAVLSE